jgi:hypothetical protein
MGARQPDIESVVDHAHQVRAATADIHRIAGLVADGTGRRVLDDLREAADEFQPLTPTKRRVLE